MMLSVHSDSAIHGIPAGSRQARARRSATIVTTAPRLHGSAPSSATVRNSKADNGTSSSGKTREPRTLRILLSTTVYHNVPGVLTSLTIHQPTPSATHAATAGHDSHRDTGRAWRARASAASTISGGASAPRESLARPATPKAKSPQSMRRHRPSFTPTSVSANPHASAATKSALLRSATPASAPPPAPRSFAPSQAVAETAATAAPADTARAVASDSPKIENAAACRKYSRGGLSM